MDIITNKIKYTKELYEKVKQYIEEIPKLNLGKFNEEIDNSIDSIESIFSQINIITKSINSKIIENTKIDEIFNLYGLINEVVCIIKIIITCLESVESKFQKKFEDITDKNGEKLNDIYNNILVAYNKYKKNVVQINVDMINKLSNIIQQQLKWTKSNAKDNSDTLTAIVKKYPHSISLYTFIIQQNINICISFSSEICDYILNQVEVVKDYIMLYNIKIQKGSPGLFHSNPILKTFGLTPSGEAEEIKNITKKLFNTSTGITGLENLAKKEKVCIVVINHVIKNPIEFNLWKLIDTNLSQPYIQSGDMGITQKTIDRFNTIIFKPLSKGKKWNFDINHYGSINSDTFVILTNLNNNLYRIYSIYNEMPIIGGGKQEIKINKSKITEFIEYVKNKGLINTRTRISEYNKIQEKKILNNMFLPVKFNIKEIKSESQIIDSKFLRREIISQTIKQFDEIIKKEYKNSEKIQTIKDIAQIIHSEKLIDVFNSILIEQYDNYAIKTKSHSDNFSFSEILQTFLSVLFNMNKDFRRLMHDYYIKAKIDPNILAEKAVIKQVKLRDIFKDIIEKVLQKIITDDRNIYQELIYKNSLLKLSLY